MHMDMKLFMMLLLLIIYISYLIGLDGEIWYEDMISAKDIFIYCIGIIS